MNWLKGLLSALVGGIANGVTLMIAEPTAFNLTTGLRQLLTVCITSGLLSAAFYIKQSPIAKPEDKCIK